MKTINLIIIFFFITQLTFASENILFDVNNQLIENEFTFLDELSSCIDLSENISVPDYLPYNTNVIEGIQLINKNNEYISGIPSFMSSIILGTAGIVTTYQVTRLEPLEVVIVVVVGVVIGAGLVYLIANTAQTSSNACNQTMSDELSNSCNNSSCSNSAYYEGCSSSSLDGCNTSSYSNSCSEAFRFF